MLGARKLQSVTVSINVNKVKAGIRCGLAGTGEKLTMFYENEQFYYYRFESRFKNEIAQTETKISCAFEELRDFPENDCFISGNMDRTWSVYLSHTVEFPPCITYSV